jgi:hypothetical protein
LQYQVREKAWTYRLNRGGYDDESSSWRGYTLDRTISALKLPGGKKDVRLVDQWVDTKVPQNSSFTRGLIQQGESRERLWLAAPKTTDVLLLAPMTNPTGLSLGHIVRVGRLDELSGNSLLRAIRTTAVRAAAISAAFLLVGRAAIELDVDPEEIDVIEPRLANPNAAQRVPVLQFADRLVNGAGLCTALGEGAPRPLIADVVDVVVHNTEQYPLSTFATDHHRDTCERACYQCLMRYSNQSYHGLLDWRLGLCFARALVDKRYSVGLDGDFSDPSLSDWHVLVDRSLQRLASRLPGVETREISGLQAFRLGSNRPWNLVVHPLWDVDHPQLIVEAASHELGYQPNMVDSFNLDRRPWLVRDAVTVDG